jgi:hypothetical protein
MAMIDIWDPWLHVYWYCLQCAANNEPVHYFSRIDGALLPAENEVEEDE